MPSLRENAFRYLQNVLYVFSRSTYQEARKHARWHENPRKIMIWEDNSLSLYTLAASKRWKVQTWRCFAQIQHKLQRACLEAGIHNFHRGTTFEAQHVAASQLLHRHISNSPGESNFRTWCFCGHFSISLSGKTPIVLKSPKISTIK